MDKKTEDHKEEIIKSLRKELVSSEIRFKNLINQNSIPILIVNKNGIIQFANPAAEFLFQRSKEKLSGENFGYPLLNGDSAEIIIPTKNSHPEIAEMRLLETIWEEEEVFLISLRDVTERRKMEQLVKSSEEKYRSLVELSPFGIYVHSEGICLFANSAGLKLLGATTPQEIIGQSVMRFIHPDYKEIVAGRIVSLHNNELKVAPIEEKFIKLDGTVIDVEVSGIQFNFEGKTAIQNFVVDITDRKKSEDSILNQKEELEAKVYQKSKQLEELNHELIELTTPLDAINKYVDELAELLREKLNDSEISKILIIKQETNKINSLLKRIL